MSSTWQRQLISALAAFVLLAPCLGAALPTAAQAPPSASLAGQLLVASPSMGDPRFERTVILMVRHDKDSAFGIVVNRPIEERPLEDLLKMLGEKDATPGGKLRIFYGGPVQPELGFVIHSSEYRQPGTIDVTGRVAMTASREILRDIGNNSGPKKSLVAFGYAGWGPGQLDAELSAGAWVHATSDEGIVFDQADQTKWHRAFARRAISL
jgi:putative transcriptional regulator